MRKIFTLTKNELTKQLKTRWFAILMLVFFLFCFASPFIDKALSPGENIDDYQVEAELQEAKLGLEKQINAPDEKSSQILQSIQTKYWKKVIELYSPLRDTSCTHWRFEFANYVRTSYSLLLTYDAIDAGCSARTVIDYLDFQYLDDAQITTYQTADKAQKAAFRADAQKNYDTESAVFASNSDTQYTQYWIDSKTADITASKKEEHVIQNKLKKTPNDTSLLRELEALQNNIAIQQKMLALEQYRLDNNVAYLSSDWRHLTLNTKKEALNVLAESVLTEREFQSSEYTYEYKDYDTYLKDIQARKSDAEETVAIADKSLQDKTPHIEFLDESYTRVPVRESLGGCYVIIFFMVMVGGSAVSAEFSKGTIRLLLIRPASRTKIFLSKLFMLLIISFSFYFIAMLLSILGYGLSLGFGDLANPVYSTVRNGTAIEVVTQNFFSWLLSAFFVSFVSIVFFCAAALFMSTLTRNTALSVTFTVLGKVFAPLLVVLLLGYKQKWVIYTFLPYVEMSDFFVSGGMMPSYLQDFGIAVNLPMACGILLGFSVILTGISLIIFNKRDVS